MPESFPQAPQEARILNNHPQTDGTTYFIIEAGAQYEDVVATLRYTSPNENYIQGRLIEILRARIDENHALDGTTVDADIHLKGSDKVSATIEYTFCERLGFRGIDGLLSSLCDPEAVIDAELGVLKDLVNAGLFAGVMVQTTEINEFQATDDSALAAEMTQLTAEFGG